MQTRIVIGLFILILFSACSEPDILSKVCASYDQPCLIRENGQVVTGNIEAKGTCILGRTACDQDKNVVCVDYVGPIEEICDGLDNDCDGIVDDGFDLDRDGYTSCGGDCDDKDGTRHPGIAEKCDNIDNNCDGNIDEELFKICWSGESGLEVNTELSQCKTGTTSCSEGEWGKCVGEIKPTPEACDGIDNNCNGEVDEIIHDGCGPRDTTGQCERGDLVCDGDDQVCYEADFGEAEKCDSIDNDCDGIVDEDLERPCATACGTGVEICEAGIWTSCSAPYPQMEVCDGIDNDCNGEVDEGCSCADFETRTCIGGPNNPIINPVDNSTISCGLGVQVCMNEEWGPCTFAGISAEICNAWDDDCDGTADGFIRTCGDPQFAGIGECRLGWQECELGLWGSCNDSVVPLDEICDGLDNDCDNETDEGLNPHTKVDIVFAIDGSGSMCGVMAALRQGLANYVADFQGLDHKFAIVMFPGATSDYDVITVPPLTDINSFIAALNGVTCNRGAFEPSYDVMYDLSSPQDPAGIGWRSDAYPYIILVTDEPAQTNSGITETNVATNCLNCQIGECVPGDRIETYVITQGAFAPQWNEPTYSEAHRIVEIMPADGDRYTDLLRAIFTNVCI